MILYEFEGLGLFDKVGIPTPKRLLVNSDAELKKVDFNPPYIAKAQVLSGKRGKAGLIREINNEAGLNGLLTKPTNGFLIEEKLTATKQFYMSITYDTTVRKPVTLFSDQGGIDIEDVKNIQKFEVDLTKDFSFSGLTPELNELVTKLWNVPLVSIHFLFYWL